MNSASLARPQLRLLDEEQIVTVHHSALKILATTGVRVDSPEVLRLLGQKIGASIIQEGRVRIPPELVEWAMHSAPAQIDIYDRLGQPAFRLGQGRARFGIGVTTLYYQDAGDDSRLEPFARRHMQEMVRLGSRLPNYDVISTVGIVQDVPAEVSDLYAVLEMVANTTKPLVMLVSDEERFPDVLDLLERLHGDLGEKPFVIPYFNPLTPLVLNRGTLDKMQLAIQRGLPLIFSNYSMAGMSTPIQAAGTLALLMAELWAGLVVSQLMRPGAPVILGILPAYFDMKSMVSFYDPHSMLLNLACAEIMQHYHLPHCGTSGSGAGWGPDLLAAETYWMNHLTACLSGGSLAPFVGDTLGSKAFSPTNVVYVHEIISQALRFSQGFPLDEAALGLEEIDQTGPAGDFLLSPSTLANFRQAYYSSPIFPRWSLEKWQAQGSPAAIQVLREYTRQVLQSLPIPEDHSDLIARGEAFIQTFGR
ncbi:MAG: trimethylamine methyltransferase family protein [Chloroflexota bacterium]